MEKRAKKKKQLMYKGKPVYRKGNRILYGNLEDDLILVIDITELEEVNGVPVTKRAAFSIRDNTGALGEGTIYRKAPFARSEIHTAP